MRARGAGGFGPLQKPVIDYAVYDGDNDEDGSDEDAKLVGLSPGLVGAIQPKNLRDERGDKAVLREL